MMPGSRVRVPPLLSSQPPASHSDAFFALNLLPGLHFQWIRSSPSCGGWRKILNRQNREVSPGPLHGGLVDRDSRRRLSLCCPTTIAGALVGRGRLMAPQRPKSAERPVAMYCLVEASDVFARPDR